MSGPGAGPGAGNRADDRVVIGQISGVWGVQGWVKVYSFTDPVTAIFDYQPWHLGDEGRAVTVQEWRQQGPRLLACMDGTSSPEAAAALVDQKISVDSSAFPQTDPGRFYWRDLIGLDVFNLQDHHYGKVRRMLATGANDVMEVTPEQGSTVLIPFVVDHFVHSVDLKEGRIVVDWPLEWLE